VTWGGKGGGGGLSSTKECVKDGHKKPPWQEVTRDYRKCTASTKTLVNLAAGAERYSLVNCLFI